MIGDGDLLTALDLFQQRREEPVLASNVPTVFMALLSNQYLN